MGVDYTVSLRTDLVSEKQKPNKYTVLCHEASKIQDLLLLMYVHVVIGEVGLHTQRCDLEI